MLITNQLFDAFIRCRFKAHLLASGATGIVSEYERLLHDLDNNCRPRSLLNLRGPFVSDQMTDVPLSLTEVVAKAYRLAENVTATAGRFSALIDAVERVSKDDAPGQAQYVPVLFTHREKLNRLDKLLLAFQSLAIAEVLGTSPTFGKIIHGRTNKVIECAQPQRKCLKCRDGPMFLCGNQAYSRLVFDLRFTDAGVRRWVVRYRSKRYICGICRSGTVSDEYPG